MKGRDDYPTLIHNTGIGAYIDSDKANPDIWLVKVMKCRVGNLRIERGWGEIWI